MRLVDDDEVYEIDGSYLGPPGRFIAVMRYKAIFLWLIVGPLTFWMMKLINIPFTLLTVGLTVIGITAIVGIISDRIGPERNVGDVARTFWQEITAPRRESRPLEAYGGDIRIVGRPPRRRRPRAGGKLVSRIFSPAIREDKDSDETMAQK